MNKVHEQIITKNEKVSLDVSKQTNTSTEVIYNSTKDLSHTI